MFNRKSKPLDLDKLLSDLENANANDEIKQVLHRFISSEIVGTTGILIVWTKGNSVDIEGSHFSEPEVVWALEKAKSRVLNKMITF